MALNLTSFDPLLKTHYSSDKIRSLADLKSPFLGMVKKNEKAGGDAIKIPIDYDNPRGGSSDFTKAKANTLASLYEAFLITRVKNYQFAYIDNETILASMGDQNAFLKALRETDKAFKAAGRRDSWQAYRTAGGAKGRCEAGTTLTGAVLNLEDHADAFNFQKGELVAFAAADGTGSLRDSGATLTVDSIQRETGTITFTANLNTITGIADTDFLFADGDFGNGLAGLGSWLPAGSGRSAALAASFYGVTRSDDPERLGGIYRPAEGEPLDEACQKLVASVAKHGGSTDCMFMNPETVSDLTLLLGSRYTPGKTQGKAGMGFSHIECTMGGDTVRIYGDVSCPTNRVYALEMATWSFLSLGGSPKFLDRDGLLQRSATADEYEVRIGGYRNLSCNAPSHNGVASITPTT